MARSILTRVQIAQVGMAWTICIAGCMGQIDDGTMAGVPGSLGGGGAGGSVHPVDPVRPVEPVVDGVGGTKGPGAVSSACKVGGAIQPGPAALRRLTSTELTNTLRDLFPGQAAAVSGLKADAFSLKTGFDNDVINLTASVPVVTSVAATADSLATKLTADPGKLLGCPGVAAGEAEIGCVRAFIKSFGERAYRRPLGAEDVSEMEGLFTKVRAAGDSLAGSTQVVLSAMLQSADFLYRVEVSPVTVKEKVVPVGPWEMATRLSYLLWGSMPDAELFAAAREGRLAAKADIEVQARRMLGDVKARQAVARFNDEWLGLHKIDNLTKDAKVFPKFTSAVAELLQIEAQKYMEDAVWSGSGDMAGLLTGTSTFMNKDLAAYYGVAGPTGATWSKVDMGASKGSGILAMGGLMAMLGTPSQTALPQRGKFVREQLLCAPPPAPPADVVATVKVPVPSASDTQRQRWAKLTAPAACNACHSLINPIGFGLENFDAAGRWRTKDGTFDIDASGEFTGTDIDGSFAGATDMAAKLAGSAQARGCLSLQWFRFAAGREESDADACTLETLRRRFEGARGNIRELIVGLTQTEAFMYRATQGD